MLLDYFVYFAASYQLLLNEYLYCVVFVLYIVLYCIILLCCESVDMSYWCVHRSMSAVRIISRRLSGYRYMFLGATAAAATEQITEISSSRELPLPRAEIRGHLSLKAIV